MRQKRAKAYKKQMVVYLHTFKFREPYQAIVDDQLVLTCVNSSFEIDKGLNRTVQGETKPMITQCCMQALYDSKDQRAIDVAKGFERRRCNHREAIEPTKCIESIASIEGQNKHRYIIASQSIDLRRALRKVPGIPLVYMNRSVMVMEPLSDASAKFSERFERKKLKEGLNDVKYTGKVVKEEVKVEKDDNSEDGPAKKKRKGPKAKGPNPLSVKKKKPEHAEKVEKSEKSADLESDKPKRRRRKGKGGAREENEGESENEEGKEQSSKQESSKEESKYDKKESKTDEIATEGTIQSKE